MSQLFPTGSGAGRGRANGLITTVLRYTQKDSRFFGSLFLWYTYYCMNQPVIVSHTEYQQLLQRVASLEKTIRRLIHIIEQHQSLYGSAAWWEAQEQQADIDIQNGDYITVNSPAKLTQLLDQWKMTS